MDRLRVEASAAHGANFAEIIETMGGKVIGLSAAERERDGISVPGTIIHEVGTVRMGSDPRTSAVNGFCQAHEAKNLLCATAALSSATRTRIQP
jgi:choline dehydrogenase-like flavoprotein